MKKRFVGMLAAVLTLALLVGPAGAEEVLHPRISTTQLSAMGEGYRTTASVLYSLISLENGQAYPQLQKALETMNAQVLRAGEERFQELQAEYEADREYMPEDADFSLEDDCTLRILRSDSTMLSIQRNFFYYGGGVHGFYSRDGLNLDAATGEELALSDLIPDRELLARRIEEQLYERYSEELYEGTFVADALAVYDTQDYCWAADSQGVHIYFNPYELAPYASGILEVSFRYDADSELFNGKYTRRADSYVLPLDPGQQALALVNGVWRELQVWPKWGEEYWIDSYQVSLDGEIREYPTMGYEAELYLVVRPEGSWVYAFGLGDNDYEFLDVLDLATGETTYYSGGLPQKLEFSDWMDGGYYYQHSVTGECFTDPELLALQPRLNALSTVGGRMEYRIGADGTLQPQSEGYTVASDVRFTTRQPLTATVAGEPVTIPEGTQVQYLATDDQSWAELGLPDGSVARVRIAAEGWPQTIDGIDLETALEGTFFAG